VDDISIATNWENKKNEVVQALKEFYKIKELGKVSKFVGININQGIDGRLFLDQEIYIDEMIKKFHLESTLRRLTPLDTNERFEENSED
jgi:hypothetical protein